MLPLTIETVRGRLETAGFPLPDPPAPIAIYVPATITGDLVFTSGQLPLVNGQLSATGTISDGECITVEEGADLARLCALNALAAVEGIVGSLERVTKIVKMVAYVASAPGFVGQSAVANGASTLLEVAFGEKGAHARSAVGVASLPLGAPVEVELTVQFT